MLRQLDFQDHTRNGLGPHPYTFQGRLQVLSHARGVITRANPPGLGGGFGGMSGIDSLA